MMGGTHVTGGMISSCVSLLLFGQSTQTPASVALFALGAGMFGSLLPDIDHPQSSLGRQLPIVSDGISLIMGHRGGMHSLLAALLVGVAAALGLRFIRLPALYSSSTFAVLAAFVLGFISHLVLDALNPSGVPFLWPFSERKFSLPLAHTGSLLETCLVFPALMLVFIILAAHVFPFAKIGNVPVLSALWKVSSKIFSIFVEVFKK